MQSRAGSKLGLVALNRFGYGARGDGDLQAASSDPRNFLKSDLVQPQIARLDGATLPDTATALQTLFADQAQKKVERERLAKEQAERAVMTTAATSPTDMAAPQPATIVPPPKPPPSPEQQIFRAEALARVQRAAQSRSGMAERLVAFWSNHFCISVAKSQFARITAGSFEREAIRPHVLGRFADMLQAVESHPSMLHFLDNAQSIGPNSAFGLRSRRGLNENLAREIMELHTLGVGGGYSQGDVTSLAMILTGWTSIGAPGRAGEPGTFFFNAAAHEPGPHMLLGRSYSQDGIAQGDAALADIARHPSTATFIATKFARHFIADEPPPALVAKLAKSFRDTDGDLKALTMTLLDADESWSPPLTKMRNPWELLIAMSRMFNRVPEDPNLILGPMNSMGMPLWAPPGPNGFPDNVGAWASPENMKLRLDLAALVGSRLKDPPNPSDLFEAVCGPAASAQTREAIGRAESRQQGLALLLMSPEIQRR